MLMVVVNIITAYKKWSQMHLRPLLKIIFFLFWITALVIKWVCSQIHLDWVGLDYPLNSFQIWLNLEMVKG
jgi:hypothetical protein